MNGNTLFYVAVAFALWWFIRSAVSRRSETLQPSASLPPPGEQTTQQFFAHSVLPSVFFSDALAVLASLSASDPAAFVRSLLEKVRPDGIDSSRPLSAEEIAVDANAFSTHTGVLVTMPSPRQTPEAFFVALAIDSISKPHVLTCEKLADPDSQNDTLAVLGRWTPHGQHIFVRTIPATREAFVNAVEKEMQIPNKSIDCTSQ